MHRHDIEAYFTREQRKVLVLKRLDPWHFRIISPNYRTVDEDHDKEAWSLKQRGWSTQAIAGVFKKSWHVANKMVADGEAKIEEELGITISNTKH